MGKLELNKIIVISGVAVLVTVPIGVFAAVNLIRGETSQQPQQDQRGSLDSDAQSHEFVHPSEIRIVRVSFIPEGVEGCKEAVNAYAVLQFQGSDRYQREMWEAVETAHQEVYNRFGDKGICWKWNASWGSIYGDDLTINYSGFSRENSAEDLYRHTTVLSGGGHYSEEEVLDPQKNTYDKCYTKGELINLETFYGAKILGERDLPLNAITGYFDQCKSRGEDPTEEGFKEYYKHYLAELETQLADTHKEEMIDVSKMKYVTLRHYSTTNGGGAMSFMMEMVQQKESVIPASEAKKFIGEIKNGEKIHFNEAEFYVKKEVQYRSLDGTATYTETTFYTPNMEKAFEIEKVTTSGSIAGISSFTDKSFVGKTIDGKNVAGVRTGDYDGVTAGISSKNAVEFLGKGIYPVAAVEAFIKQNNIDCLEDVEPKWLAFWEAWKVRHPEYFRGASFKPSTETKTFFLERLRAGGART